MLQSCHQGGSFTNTGIIQHKTFVRMILLTFIMITMLSLTRFIMIRILNLFGGSPHYLPTGLQAQMER